MHRIGILGGTFDPPHIGHLILADYALESLDLNRLLFVPAADPPHKLNGTRSPIRHRLAMLERAVADDPRFQIARVDIDRPGPHYSVDTVRLLQEQYPTAELYFLMGADSLRDLPTWRRPTELLRLCKLAVMPRPDIDALPDMHESHYPGSAQRIVMLDAPLVGISSTEIVARVQQGKSIRYLVPAGVLAYLQEHQVYQVES